MSRCGLLARLIQPREGSAMTYKHWMIINIYNPDQKSLGHLTKLKLVTHYFEVGSHYLICWTSLLQNNLEILSLLLMNINTSSGSRLWPKEGPRPRGVLGISSDEGWSKDFFGFEIFDSGIFLGYEYLASIFLGSWIWVGIFLGVLKRIGSALAA